MKKITSFLSSILNGKGVRYKYGGNSKNGIDCSAFIQRAYNTSYNIKIPRTTKYQSKIGREIRKNQLKTGDLVFFKTGYNTRHVGIYTNNGKFMHASTKKGVIISTLEKCLLQKTLLEICESLLLGFFLKFSYNIS